MFVWILKFGVGFFVLFLFRVDGKELDLVKYVVCKRIGCMIIVMCIDWISIYVRVLEYFICLWKWEIFWKFGNISVCILVFSYFDVGCYNVNF